MTQPRISADDHGFALAAATALRADCTRRQVGAVIMSRDGRVLATGYNGYPAGVLGCQSGGCDRGKFSHKEIPADSAYVGVTSPCFAIHAEENALLYSSRRDIEGGTIYVTAKPCPNCERLLFGSGLEKVRYLDPDGEKHSLDLSAEAFSAR